MGFRATPSVDPTTLPSRCTLVFLAICLTAPILSSLLRLPPNLRAKFLHNPLDTFNNNALVTTSVATLREIPPALSPVVPQPDGPVHHFTVPTVIAYYADNLPRNRTRVYLITSGIMMKVSQRNLNAIACMIGNDVYPASFFTVEVLHCDIPRVLRPQERLVAVLAWDERLKRAAQAPQKLATGVVAEIRPGDIDYLPDSAVLHGELKHAQRGELRVVRSDARVGPSDDFVEEKAKNLPRYRLCLMTMVAPNSHMLKDWADYHRRIGVDQVYIFDNGAERDLEKMFEGRVDVEIVKWPYHKSQLQAVSMFVFAGRARCERVLLEDSDEYPMFGLGEGTSWREGFPPLIRYAKKMEEKGFMNYKLLHIVMVNSGFLYRPKGEVPMNFIHRRDNQYFRNGKSVCHLDIGWNAGAIHHCGYMQRGRMPVIHRHDIRSWGEIKMTPEKPDDPPFLMHFRDRSWEEYIEKWDAGRVAGKLVADEKAGSMSIDDPDEKYMEVHPEFKYTHFRDKIYRRVLKEGTLDEQTIVQMKNGKRCERLYKINMSTRQFVHEVCVFP